MKQYEGFYFRTTCPGDELEEYFAHYIDGHYYIVVERNNLTAYVDLTAREVFDKWRAGEWVIVKK